MGHGGRLALYALVRDADEALVSRSSTKRAFTPGVLGFIFYGGGEGVARFGLRVIGERGHKTGRRRLVRDSNLEIVPRFARARAFVLLL